MTLVLLALHVAVAASAAGQATLRVNVLRALSFDALASGMPVPVRGNAPTDTGVFEVIGPAGAVVEVWLTLPDEFSGPRGDRLPVSFDATSAAYSAAQSMADRQVFDPRLRHEFRIPATGRFLVFITGRVTVQAAQRPGRYRASILLFAHQVS
jgi:hypothetical protein